jgi:hypothetical protein
MRFGAGRRLKVVNTAQQVLEYFIQSLSAPGPAYQPMRVEVAAFLATTGRRTNSLRVLQIGDASLDLYVERTGKPS